MLQHGMSIKWIWFNDARWGKVRRLGFLSFRQMDRQTESDSSAFTSFAFNRDPAMMLFDKILYNDHSKAYPEPFCGIERFEYLLFSVLWHSDAIVVDSYLIFVVYNLSGNQQKFLFELFVLKSVQWIRDEIDHDLT